MLKFVGLACGLIALSAVIGYTSAGKNELVEKKIRLYSVMIMKGI